MPPITADKVMVGWGLPHRFRAVSSVGQSASLTRRRSSVRAGYGPIKNSLSPMNSSPLRPYNLWLVGNDLSQDDFKSRSELRGAFNRELAILPLTGFL